MRNRYVLLADLPIIALAALGAFVLRFDWFFSRFQHEFLWYVTAALLVKPVIFYLFGMYSRYWRYATVTDLVALVLAVSTSSILMALLVGAALLTDTIEQFARSVVLIDWLLTIVAVTGVRAAIRIVGESRLTASAIDHASAGEPRRILVAGAGDAGAMVVREMQRNPQLGMIPVGFIDDDAAKIGKKIYGLPVLGSIASLPEAAAAHRIDLVTIAMPSAPGAVVRAVVEACQKLSLPSRTMPGMYELLDGDVSVNRFRNVEIADLLRRSQVELKKTAGNYVSGRTVLVTGAGGSIGLELCRQVAHRNPASLILLGHGENSLFDAQLHLRRVFPRVPIRLVVADIRDERRVHRVFQALKPQIVFHTAAHKHVPLMEENLEEAISNNVLGTDIVVRASLAAGSERFVLISTDKAVSSTSVMGASKQFAERIVQQAAREHGRSFVVVRFGNVLGSRGSVVPIFKEQIERGGPVTITHPEMRRFFMTIPEAVHLVLEAGGMGKGGELFVLRMGEPVRIIDLVHDLIRLSGLELEDIPIVYTGVRPGEKLEESLWEDGADVAGTAHPDVLRVIEAQPCGAAELSSARIDFARAVADGDQPAIDAILARSIPTYARNRAGAVAVQRTTT
jgi:FlaA1/EpsC-like NDP-sugar epimerase